MADTLRDFSAAIQNLISINRDAEQGFRAAADAVTDPELKRMFVHLSHQRASFATEIQHSVRNLGFEPSNPLGAAGTLRGVWIAFKGAMLANKEHAVLVETERGEDQSIRAYREAQAFILQPDLRNVLDRQFVSVQESHARVRTLRDRTAPPPTTASATATRP